MNTSRFIVHTMPVEVQISLGGRQIFDGFPIFWLYFSESNKPDIGRRPGQVGGSLPPRSGAARKTHYMRRAAAKILLRVPYAYLKNYL